MKVSVVLFQIDFDRFSALVVNLDQQGRFKRTRLTSAMPSSLPFIGPSWSTTMRYWSYETKALNTEPRVEAVRRPFRHRSRWL
jgi:hypothetical protein